MSVALTGNVAAGKSTVVRLFATWGATVIDADAIVRDVQRPGSPVLATMVARFGSDILDPNGELRRDRLRDIITADATARDDLNHIVHPAVQERRAARLAEAARDCIVISDIPLLFEVADPGAFDVVVLVDAPRALRRARMVSNRGLTADAAERLIDAQMPADAKRAGSTFVIDNTGSLGELEAAARAVWQALRQRAGGGTGKRLLAVFAHPDDEAFATGGTLARYADGGAEVHVACLTAGEAATARDPGLTPDDVRARRRADLTRSAAALGVHRTHHYDFPDGQLDAASVPGATACAELLRSVDPHCVIGFGHDGVTGHADHVAAHHWIRRAALDTGYGDALVYVAYPSHVAQRLPFPLATRADAAVVAHIDVRPWGEAKRAAIAAHSTQRPPFDLDDDRIAVLFEWEWYAPEVPRPGGWSDLFAAAEPA